MPRTIPRPSADSSRMWTCRSTHGNEELRTYGLPDHLFGHILTMARLHAAGRYDRLTNDVEAITGRPATSTRDFVAHHPEVFGPAAAAG